MHMIRSDGSTGLPAFDAASPLAPAPICRWSRPPIRGSPGWQTRIILRLAGVYIQEFLLVAQLTQPSARSRTSGVGLSDPISRKQVASDPLQVARVSDFINLRIKVIGGVKRHRGTAALPSCNTGLDVE